MFPTSLYCVNKYPEIELKIGEIGIKSHELKMCVLNSKYLIELRSWDVEVKEVSGPLGWKDKNILLCFIKIYYLAWIEVVSVACRATQTLTLISWQSITWLHLVNIAAGACCHRWPGHSSSWLRLCCLKLKISML